MSLTVGAITFPPVYRQATTVVFDARSEIRQLKERIAQIEKLLNERTTISVNVNDTRCSLNEIPLFDSF